MVSKILHVAAGLALIAIGTVLIWHEHLWGLFIVIIGMTVATRKWGPRGHRPWRQEGDGGSGGGGSRDDDGSGDGGDGGGGVGGGGD